MNKKSKAKKATDSAKDDGLSGLMNWPPSRGPQPAWMRAKPKYEIPKVEVLLVEWSSKRDRYGDRTPSIPLEMTPLPKVKKPGPKQRKPKLRGRTMVLGSYSKKEHAALKLWKLAEKVELSVWADVEACATLRPEHWELVAGAKLGTRRRLLPKGKVANESVAYVELDLPETAITFDLTYPLSCIARVTVRPYTVRQIGMDEKEFSYTRMTVGYVLHQLAKAYEEIYKHHEEYGIWGHALRDLCFSGLVVERGVGNVDISSLGEVR